jgi:hypothetical protein
VRRIYLYCFGLILWLPGVINAQRVIYSESMSTRTPIRFQVIGESENFYWVAKLQWQKSKSHHEQESNIEIRDFELFDNRLHLISEQSPVYIPGTAKQWLMTGNKGLDQVMSIPSGNNTNIFCNRYRSDRAAESRLIDSFPFSANTSSILLVRSENQAFILLVAFENTDPESTIVHIHLFDAGWNPVYRKIISDIQFSQPCIQDDEIGFPSEGFDNLPIKVANNGEWGMIFPSHISHHFSLFHACPNGEDYFFKEIAIAPFYKMEDVSMSVNNDRQELSVGLLSTYRNTSLKNVQVFNYSMREGRFDFDSSYHFNEQARDIRSKNLSHESFISVPDGGYMLLKEYGSLFEFEKPNIPPLTNWEAAYLLANYSEVNSGEKVIKSGYTRNRGLSPIPAVRNKGDLNIFYFPSVSNDSTWSAILEMEQHTETNNPDLSYLLMPAKNKLYLIYNTQDGSADPLATTTTLNSHGETTGDGLVFWKMDKMLNFQNARRFTADEVAVPYLDNQRPGFAIIRLH